MMQNKILSLLNHIEHTTSPDDLIYYGKDWTSFYQPNPIIVFFPKNVKEAHEIVLKANELNFSIVPSGGRTGLSGGAVASNKEVVVSFKNMGQIINFDPLEMKIKVQGGIITEEVQKFALSHQLYYPIDLASKGSCTIGGNIATNAGGIHVTRYGSTRNQVIGLKVITGKGDILELNHGLMKNATGFSLMQNFIGSEGVLGLILEATLQLIPAPHESTNILLAVDDLENSLFVLKTVKELFNLNAFEFFDHKCLQYVVSDKQLSFPFPSPSNYYLLLDVETSSIEKIEDFISKLYGDKWIVDDKIALNNTDASKLWEYREEITSAIQVFSPYKNDISVSPTTVPYLIKEIEKIMTQYFPQYEVLFFGHLGDGNVHVNLLKPDDVAQEAFEKIRKKFSHLLYSILKDKNGSISAEHGIGLLKKEYLHYSLSETEIAYLKEIKKVFDPQCIMNPGKLI